MEFFGFFKFLSLGFQKKIVVFSSIKNFICNFKSIFWIYFDSGCENFITKFHFWLKFNFGTETFLEKPILNNSLNRFNRALTFQSPINHSCKQQPTKCQIISSSKNLFFLSPKISNHKIHKKAYAKSIPKYIN